MKKLQDKVAVITGANSGMALATAKLFVEEGAYVFITGRRQADLDAAVQAIGHDVTGVRCDSANLADLDNLFELVQHEKGKVDILYASAGYAEPGPVLGTITEEQFDKHFDLNAKGTLFTVQKALPLMSEGASVIMTGTVATTKSIPGMSVYTASKLVLLGYAKVWSLELKSRRIRFNVLSPGATNTAIMAALPPETVAAYAAMIPFGRVVEPEDIAATALFLASDDSSLVTGMEINVDGAMALA